MGFRVRRLLVALSIFSVGTPFLLFLRVSEIHRQVYPPDLKLVVEDIHHTTNNTLKYNNDTHNKTSLTTPLLSSARFGIKEFINGTARSIVTETNQTRTSHRTFTSFNNSTQRNSTIDPCRSRYVIDKIPARILPDQRILFMDGVGRLGNKMFQYAGLLGIARNGGFKPLVHKESLIVQVFEISHVTEIKYKKLPVYFEKAAAKYDSCLETVGRDLDWRLGGYYQSWKYFRNVEDEIRKEFTFKAHIQNSARKKLDELLKEFGGRTKVGVHVRRGDMSIKSSIKKGYTVANKDYFKKAMSYFRQRLKDPVFVVLTDDKNWVKKNLLTEKDVKLVQGDKNTDLATLASCDHSIVSTGTYGWWGAWLAGGITVYYKDFPNNGSWLATQYNAEDYFPPSWIGMN